MSYNLRNSLQHSGINALNYNYDCEEGNKILLNSHEFALSDEAINKNFRKELLERDSFTINVIEQLYQYKDNIDKVFYKVHHVCSKVLIDEKMVINIKICNLIEANSPKAESVYALVESAELDGEQRLISIKKFYYHALKDSIYEFRKIFGEENYMRLSDIALETLGNSEPI